MTTPVPARGRPATRALPLRAACGGAALALIAGAAAAQGLPGAPGSGGGPLPALPRDEVAAPARLPAARPVPHIADAAPRPPADPAALGIVTHLPGGATTERAAPDGVRAALAAPPAAPAPVTPHIIGPQDTRERVTDTAAYPARATGLLISDFGGLESYCTAALVGPSAILTAAHCVHDPALGWADDARFIPGLDGRDTDRFGAWPVVAMHLPTGFLTQRPGDYAAVVGYDIALLHLAAPVGDALGWFGYGEAEDPDPARTQASRLRLRSYPGDKPAGTQWQADCTHWPLPGETGLAAHDCPTFAGASGGPMYPPGPDGPAPRIVAVNVAETATHNLGVAIGPAWAAWLTELWR